VVRRVQDGSFRPLPFREFPVARVAEAGYGLRMTYEQEHGSTLPRRATTSLDEAVDGADFVFSAVRAGGVEMVALSARLDPEVAEQAVAASQGGAFVGIRVATMNADGNLFLVHHPVARLTLDARGHIRGAEPAIHRSLSGFVDIAGPPPGDQLQSNKKTPFVWADEQSGGR
jgi:hypothetical protein